MLRHATNATLLLALATACAAGCKQGAFQPPAGQANAATNVWQQQATTLTSQVQDLNRRVGHLDLNNADLHRQLAAAEQQRLKAVEQANLFQQQLQTAAKQLQDTQVARTEADKQVTALQASTRLRGGATITANNSIQQSLSAVSIPGLEIRQDGEVIRIEVPADKLFTPGSAQLTTDGYRLLDEVASAVQRSYPRQRIVVEGHTDDSFAGNATAAHALASQQAGAAFQQLVERGKLPAQQLSVLALGENHPLASNGTAAGKAKNRRVEIVVYPDTIN